MNKVYENEVRLANLEAAAEMRRAELMAIFQPLSLSVAKVLNDAIAASGSTKYAVRTDGGNLRDTEWIEIEGVDEGDRLVGVTVHLRKASYWDESVEGDKASERVFSFSTCGFGDVKAGDTKGVAYCLLVGYLAAHATEIQNALNAIPEWKNYDRAVRIYHFSDGEARAFAQQMKVDAENAACAKAEERLVVGAEIAVDYEKKWDCEKCESVITGVRVKTVEKVTNKLVFFKDDYHRYNKADVCYKLVRGLEKGGYSYAADVDLSKAGVSRPVSR